MGQLTCLGRHTVTGMLCSTGQQFKDWSADYRLYSEERFCDESLFECISEKVCSFLKPEEPVIGDLESVT